MKVEVMEKCTLELVLINTLRRYDWNLSLDE